MKRACAATSVLLFLSSPCTAQSAALRGLPQPLDNARLFAPLAIPEKALSFPVIDFQEPNGSTTRGRGIMVRQELAPNISLGFGLLSLKPRRSTLSPDPQLEPTSRGSRKAAARLTIAF